MLCITILNSLKNATYSKGYGHYFTPSFNVTFHSKAWNKWATPNFVCFWVYACVCVYKYWWKEEEVEAAEPKFKT